MDIICFLWNSSSRGKIEGSRQDLAQMFGLEWSKFNTLIDAIKRKGVTDLTEANEKLTIVSRRMIREENTRESNNNRQKKYYENHRPNAIITPKKLEAKKLEAKNTTLSPSGDGARIASGNGEGETASKAVPGFSGPARSAPLSDVQKIVKGWKIVTGIPTDDGGWDSVHFSRHAKSAKSLLTLFGSWEKAVECIEHVYNDFESRKLSCTIETVVKHSDKFREILAKEGK